MSKSKKLPYKYSLLICIAAYIVFLIIGTLVFNGINNGYIKTIILLIGINIVLACSLNVTTGYLGQLPLGHAGFMAVGGYAAGLFLKALPIELTNSLFPVAILLAGVIAAIFGFIIGIPALRLKGDYLAIITLGFGEIIRVFITNIDSVLTKIAGHKVVFTNGVQSLQRIPKTTNFLNTFIIIGIMLFLIHTLIKSKHGRAILALRDNEIAAKSCGINITFYKTFGFVFSAFFAGIAGALYAGCFQILSPGTFSFNYSIEILVIVVFGGIGSIPGSIISAIVLTILKEFTKDFSQYSMVVYALILILFMIFNYAPFFKPLKTRLTNSIINFKNKIINAFNKNTEKEGNN